MDIEECEIVDEKLDEDIEFSYMDAMVDRVLGDGRKCFSDLTVVNEVLGPMYGQYGTFLPTKIREPSVSILQLCEDKKEKKNTTKEVCRVVHDTKQQQQQVPTLSRKLPKYKIKFQALDVRQEKKASYVPGRCWKEATYGESKYLPLSRTLG